MFLTELDVVNDCLGLLGETPLNEVDTSHPLVPAVQRFLRVANNREQGKGWWFNREILTITPDVNGYLNVPNDTISIRPNADSLMLAQRGQRLYDTIRGSYVFTQPVECILVRAVPFTDLPSLAQTYISTAAQVDFGKSHDADPVKYAQVVKERDENYRILNAEHIRAQKANLLNNRSFAEKFQAIAPGTVSRLPVR